jgi:putative transposase
MITTWRFRIKDSGSSGRKLCRMARAVNFVWNYAKSTQIAALKARSGRIILDKKTGLEVGIPNFLSSSELDALVAGSSKELGLHSQTVQGTVQEYSTRRIQFKKLLRWRGRKSLGWIPFKAAGIKFNAKKIIYCGNSFKYWNSRSLPDDAVIKTGSFNQDTRGRWYVSIVFDSLEIALEHGIAEVGVDPGIKTLATISDGTKIERPNLRAIYLEKLRKYEKTRKFARRKQAKERKFGKLPKAKQVANLAAKIANKRNDYLHKESTKLIQRTKIIAMGDVPCKLMNRNRKLSGISLDSGLGMFKNMLNFKAKRAGSTYVEVSERNSTQTCFKCGTKPLLRIGLGVRNWTCDKCNEHHDRDINAARNILQTYRSKSAQDVVLWPTCAPPKRRHKPKESPCSKLAIKKVSASELNGNV